MSGPTSKKSDSQRNEALFVRKEMERAFVRAVSLCARYIQQEDRVGPHVQAIAELAASLVADLALSYAAEIDAVPAAPVASAVRLGAHALAPMIVRVAYGPGHAPLHFVRRISELAETDLLRSRKNAAWQLTLIKIFEVVPLFKHFPADPTDAALYLLERLRESCPNLPKNFARRDPAALEAATAVMVQLQGRPPVKSLRIARWDEYGHGVRAGRSTVNAWKAMEMFSDAFGVTAPSAEGDAEW
jgi:hypothetical protein